MIAVDWTNQSIDDERCARRIRQRFDREGERLRENERESYANSVARRERKKRGRENSEAEKMIFNISDRLHLITRPIRASTWSSVVVYAMSTLVHSMGFPLCARP